MNFFHGVRYYKDGLRAVAKKIEAVLVSKKYVARGYVYVVEHDDKHYILVNSTDFNAALSRLPSYTIDKINLSARVFDIPIVENEGKAFSVQTGVFRWASRLS